MLGELHERTAAIMWVGAARHHPRIVGLAANLPHAMSSGLQAHRLPAATADRVAGLPPVSILFAAFLGYNPIEHLVGTHALSALPAPDQATLTGSSFFPHLISGPFQTGLHAAFSFAIAACLVAAAASWMRGARLQPAPGLTGPPTR
ncbi:MAG TPA: hypothetical protein VGO81_18140 [Solirubrobacteraceae bacterium]|nr:hypothetical protein [Solirubrobacteraceae bacterium]